jgi:hypothetical protein
LISTRSNDLARVLSQRLLLVLLQVLLQGTFEGVLLKYLRLAVRQGGSCGISGYPAGVLWGFIKGARAT